MISWTLFRIVMTISPFSLDSVIFAVASISIPIDHDGSFGVVDWPRMKRIIRFHSSAEPWYVLALRSFKDFSLTVSGLVWERIRDALLFWDVLVC